MQIFFLQLTDIKVKAQLQAQRFIRKLQLSRSSPIRRSYRYQGSSRIGGSLTSLFLQQSLYRLLVAEKYRAAQAEQQPVRKGPWLILRSWERHIRIKFLQRRVSLGALSTHMVLETGQTRPKRKVNRRNTDGTGNTGLTDHIGQAARKVRERQRLFTRPTATNRVHNTGIIIIREKRRKRRSSLFLKVKFLT